MSKKILTDYDFNKNEIQNAVVQPLASAPSSPREGQIYYSTTDDTVYVFADGEWLDLGVQGGAGATNLSATLSATQTVINSDTGTDATIPAVDGTNAGVMTPTMKNKLDGIETGADVTDAANVDAAGATMNTDTSLAGNSYFLNENDMASNSATKVPSQASVKAYADNLLQGLSWKQAVRVATTANATLASAFENGDTVDGVTLVTGDRILIKDQTTQTENGIYTVNASGAPTRAADANTGAELRGATVYVEEGTTNADTAWSQTTNATITIGSTNIVFALINGGAVPVASTTTQGKVELATQAETEAKSDTGRAVTPSGLANFSQKKTFTFGDGAETTYTLTHNLGTKEVITQLRQASDDAIVEADVVNATTNTVTVTFSEAPSSNAIKAVVLG